MFIKLTTVSDIFQSNPTPLRVNPGSITTVTEMDFARGLGTGSTITVEVVGELTVVESPDEIDALISEVRK